MNLIRRKYCMFKIVAPRAEYPYCPSSLLSSLRVQSQVTGVIGIMRDNLSKVLDRGEKLEDLEGKSGKEPYLLRGDHTLTLGSCQVFSVLYSFICMDTEEWQNMGKAYVNVKWVGLNSMH